MITNTGKDLVAKYLIGQSPAYASYVAIGCGATPKKSGQTLDNYADKTELDFEMLRVPIISRGYVTDMVDGLPVSKVVFTAELPTEQRYVLSEIGVFSAKANPSATSKDSRVLYAFTETENWQYHTESTVSTLGTTITVPLYGQTNDNIIKADQIDPTLNPVFRASSDNAIFTSESRLLTNEPPRFLNSSVFMPGNTSWLVVDSGTGVMSVKPTDGTYHGTHIHVTGTRVDLSKNSPSDELRLAFSVVNKDGADTTQPTKVRVMVEFSREDTDGSVHYARFQVEAQDIATNRYRIAKSKLSELTQSTGFTWNSVTTVKVYATVFDGTTPSDKFYVCLDALRFENLTSQNPLYGLTGYSVTRTDTGYPIVKATNTSNMVEFRFGLDVT